MTSDERYDVLLVIKLRLRHNMAQSGSTRYESEQASWRERMDECDILLKEMERELPAPVDPEPEPDECEAPEVEPGEPGDDE